MEEGEQRVVGGGEAEEEEGPAWGGVEYAEDRGALPARAHEVSEP
jgi:hypothetical protein